MSETSKRPQLNHPRKETGEDSPTSDGYAATMPGIPGNAATAPGRQSGETIPEQQAAAANDPGPTRILPNSIEPSADVTNFPATQYQPSGIMDTLDQVRGEVKRKSVAVLHTKIGDYEIEKELGRGAMGVVYKARHRQLRRDVALKMILSGRHAGPEQLERFLSEARAVAQLQHPNIVQIFDIGEQDGLPYFSLEYVDGQSMAQQLDKQPQPAEEAGRMIELLARAMQCAHDHGILHRDLKPANVLLTKEGTPKISDFGLAKKVDDDEAASTRTGTVMGTPSYMAPEQARGMVHDVGPAADQYSLGAMLYEMLTGRPPFLAPKAVETILQVINEEPVPPRQLLPNVPIDLETICLKALQKDPAKRYGSCMELAEDARRFREGIPILARPVSRYERVARWCRRNPRMAALTATVIILLLAVPIISTAFAIQLKNERDMTERERNVAVEARDHARRKEHEAATAALAERAARVVADQKTKEAEQAKQLADDSAIVAAQQGRLAVETLFNVVTEVQKQLRDRDDMLKLREDLLQNAMKGLERVTQTAETSPLTQRTRGGAFQRAGDIMKELGRTQEALQYYENSRQVFEKLINHPQADVAEIATYNLAVVCDKLGDVKHQLGGDAAGAKEYYQKCLELREKLLSAPLKSPEVKPNLVKGALAGSYTKYGGQELIAGNPAAARDYYLKALAIREELAKAGPQNSQTRRVLASSYTTLADVYFRLNDAERSREFHQKALDLRQQVAADEPESVSAKQELAAAYGARGDLELQLNNPQIALERYRDAFDLHQARVKKNPESAEARQELSLSYYRIATVHLNLGQQAESDQAYAESLKIRKDLYEADPKNTYKQIEYMLALARTGDHTAAAKIADQLSNVKNAGILFYAACGYSLCVPAIAHHKESLSAEELELQKRYRQTALNLLNQAIELGYGDRVALTTDPDLAPLRSGAEFNTLVQKLTAK